LSLTKGLVPKGWKTRPKLTRGGKGQRRLTKGRRVEGKEKSNRENSNVRPPRENGLLLFGGKTKRMGGGEKHWEHGCKKKKKEREGDWGKGTLFLPERRTLTPSFKRLQCDGMKSKGGKCPEKGERVF